MDRTNCLPPGRLSLEDALIHQWIEAKHDSLRTCSKEHAERIAADAELFVEKMLALQVVARQVCELRQGNLSPSWREELKRAVEAQGIRL